jgi:hypothetical protein
MDPDIALLEGSASANAGIRSAIIWNCLVKHKGPTHPPSA